MFHIPSRSLSYHFLGSLCIGCAVIPRSEMLHTCNERETQYTEHTQQVTLLEVIQESVRNKITYTQKFELSHSVCQKTHWQIMSGISSCTCWLPSMIPSISYQLTHSGRMVVCWSGLCSSPANFAAAFEQPIPALHVYPT